MLLLMSLQAQEQRAGHPQSAILPWQVMHVIDTVLLPTQLFKGQKLTAKVGRCAHCAWCAILAVLPIPPE